MVLGVRRWREGWWSRGSGCGSDGTAEDGGPWFRRGGIWVEGTDEVWRGHVGSVVRVEDGIASITPRGSSVPVMAVVGMSGVMVVLLFWNVSFSTSLLLVLPLFLLPRSHDCSVSSPSSRSSCCWKVRWR